MIVTSEFQNDLYRNGSGFDYEYYGNDTLSADVRTEIKEDIKKLIFKDCVVDTRNNGKQEGIIIGFEISNLMYDYYYIVYIPKLKTTEYILANNHEFYKQFENEKKLKYCVS